MDKVSLVKALRKSRVKCEQGNQSYYIPYSDLRELIKPKVVLKYVKDTDNQLDAEEVARHAKHACENACRVVAVLVYNKKEQEILSLLQEGIADNDLPFSTATRQRENGKPIKCFDRWSEEDLEDFDRIQWWMNAPILNRNEHYDFKKGTLLPFVPFTPGTEPGEKKEGAYSEVIPARIHDAHHKFWTSDDPKDQVPLVAIKRLFSTDEKEFKKEQSILSSISVKRHPHLIDLLVSYRHEGKYNLMFPYAQSNLRGYWDARPHPNFNRNTLLWSIKQMEGIASGLHLVHNFRVTIPLEVDGGMRMQNGAQLSVGKGEERFGRHGDIKPENILWFDRIYGAEPGKQDPMGILKIADFGLGRFHGRDSRSAQDPRWIVSSPTYEPPECKLKKPVSRAYDLWSLGCLYLEFLTWILMGAPDIEGFADFRGKTGTGGVNDDNFFTITSPPGSDEPEAELRQEVGSWARKLHCHNRCSQALHDILELIMKGLLIIRQKDRLDSMKLKRRLQEIYKRAQRDDTYLLKPVPYPKRIGEFKSTSEPTISNGHDRKRKKVTWSDDISPDDLSSLDLPRQKNEPVADLLSNVQTFHLSPSQAPTWPLIRHAT
ncbi:protein kinase [Phlyctema vagabunda]|uniref:Protein kinase n=1 Tax=Phlyctema vagabunda TaxID=108571 RepID=A0ABR4P9T4_9HELO